MLRRIGPLSLSFFYCFDKDYIPDLYNLSMEKHVRAPEFDPSNPISSAAEVIKAVFLRPQAFYRGFSAEGPVREPVLFVLLVSAVTGVLSVAVSLASVLIFGEMTFFILGLTLLQALAFILLSPVAVGVVAAVYLLSIRTFVGNVSNLREVYRMAAYAYGVMILAWVPLVYAFLVTYALMVLMGFGIRSVYRTSFMTAVVTALVGFVPVASALILLRVVAVLPFG